MILIFSFLLDKYAQLYGNEAIGIYTVCVKLK